MIIRGWLRIVKALSEKARRVCLHSFFRRRIFSIRFFIPPHIKGVAPSKIADTDTIIKETDYCLRIMASEKLSIDKNYQEWLSALAEIPPGAAGAEIKKLIERLDGFDPNGQLFFPLDEHLNFMRHNLGDVCEWVQFITTARQPGLNTILKPDAQGADAASRGDRSVVIIHGIKANCR